MDDIKEKDLGPSGPALLASQTIEPLDEVHFAIARGDWGSLRKLSVRPGGFGVEGRKEAWPFLLHAQEGGSKPDRRSAATLTLEKTGQPETSIRSDQTLVADDDEEPHPDERQVKLDTDRSFVMYPPGSEKDRVLRKAQLNQLIVAILRKRRKLSYFQGYHDVISVLYLTLPSVSTEAGLPPLLVSCGEKISLHRLRDAMGTGLDPLLGLLRILKRLLRVADPELARIVEHSSPLPYFALSNILTLFSHDVPTLPLIQRIFDFLLCRHPLYTVYLVASFVLARKAEITKLAEEGEDGMMHAILSELPRMSPDGLEESERTKRRPVSSSPERAHSQSRAPDDINMRRMDEVFNTVETRRGHADPAGDESHNPLASSQKDEYRSGSPDTTATAYDDLDSTHSLLEVSSVTADTDFTLRSPSPPPKYEDIVPRGENSLEQPDATIVDMEPEDVPGVIPVSSLLVQADALFARFPPLHPSIAVNEVMGPNSVIFTWSERDRNSSSLQPASNGQETKEEKCLPSDEDAEDMVLDKTRVVLPYDPLEDMPMSDDEGESEGEYKAINPARNPRRRHTVPFFLDIARMDKTTVLTGMVLILGVGVALYLQTSDRRGWSANLNSARAYFPEWRKWAAWAGGIALGVGGVVDDDL